jgi:hypothetical protein
MPLAISQVRSLAAGPFVLPAPRTVDQIGDACRDAVADFSLSRAAQPAWGRLELARWLAHRYRPLVTLTPRATPISSVPPSRRPVTPGEIGHLMNATHRRLGEVLRAIATEQDLGFVYEAIREGWVERCKDTLDARGWLPVARPGMRLCERVLSLLAADCLVHPRRYDRMRHDAASGAIAFLPAPAPAGRPPERLTNVTALTGIR